MIHIAWDYRNKIRAPAPRLTNVRARPVLVMLDAGRDRTPRVLPIDPYRMVFP